MLLESPGEAHRVGKRKFKRKGPWRELEGSKTKPRRREGDGGIPGLQGSMGGRTTCHLWFGQTHRTGHWVRAEDQGRRAAEARPLWGRP